MKQPKLSVCLITYNHQAFVKQALDGILMQQCNFDWEVVIGDDCSKDNTGAIVEEYATKYPERIRLNKPGRNLGMTENWRQTIAACKGEYIALLEGDDYWTDPLKLQKNIDVLDANPRYSFVCNDVETIFEPGSPTIDRMSHPGVSKEYTIEEFINWKGAFFVATGSIVLRKTMLGDFPPWANKDLKVSIDVVTELMLSSHGPFYYMNERMGKYRIHSAGVSQVSWLGRENLFEFDVIYILSQFDSFSNKKYHHLINSKKEWLYLQLLNKNLRDSKEYRRALFGLMRIDWRKHLDLFKGWMIDQLPPGLYKVYRKIF